MTRDPRPPTPARRPLTRTCFGDTCVDEYAWLRDKEDPAVRAHMQAERDYAEAMLEARTGDLRERLYAEMRGRIKEDERSLPARDGPWLYYSRTEVGDEYPRHCRRPWAPNHEHLDLDVLDALEIAEQLYLDENDLAEPHEYFDLSSLSLSPNHRLCAYAIDTVGDEVYAIHVRELETGRELADRLPGCASRVAWGDDQQLFYARLDDRHRPWQIWRHRLGSDPSDDVLLFQEDDEQFYLSLHRTRSDAFVVITCSSHTSSELWLIPTADPDAAPMLVASREPEVEYDVDHRGEHLFILDNCDGAQNFQLWLAPLPTADGPSDRSRWTRVIDHRDDVLLEDIDAFADYLIVWEKVDGLQRLRVIPREGVAGEAHLIDFPDPTYAIGPGSNSEFAATTLRFAYTSLTTPMSTYDYQPATRTMTLRKRSVVVGGHEVGDYRSARLWATASDGERVPISLVWRVDDGCTGEGERPSSPRPLLLYGYGAYGAATDASFSSARLSLLQRGVIWAIAHVRGGDELGRRWYEGGKLAAKPNTFSDFIACAEHLCAQGWTRPQQLAAMGGSAGGLLIGAVANARPDLFAAMIADVPFVDVLTTMLDDSLPLTAIEWDEWGNPATEQGYRWIRAYSPYDNVRAQSYPHTLVLAGWNDPRVGYWEAAKWVTRLRERDIGGAQILLWTNMEAGHLGASGRFEYLRELALEYAFLLERLGVPEPGDRRG